MTTALPVSVTPRPGESIEAWLEHLADACGDVFDVDVGDEVEVELGPQFGDLAPEQRAALGFGHVLDAVVDVIAPFMDSVSRGGRHADS